VALCVTDRAGVQPGRGPSPQSQTSACSYTTARSLNLPFNGLHHRNSWLTAHSPTSGARTAGLVGWSITDSIPTKWLSTTDLEPWPLKCRHQLHVNYFLTHLLTYFYCFLCHCCSCLERTTASRHVCVVPSDEFSGSCLTTHPCSCSCPDFPMTIGLRSTYGCMAAGKSPRPRLVEHV